MNNVLQMFEIFIIWILSGRILPNHCTLGVKKKPGGPGSA